MDLNNYKQLIQNHKPIFAIYNDKGSHAFSEILFFGLTEDGIIHPLCYDSEQGLCLADETAGWRGYHYGPIEHVDYENY